MPGCCRRIAGLGSWEWDLDSGEMRWSDGIYRVYGVTSQSFDPTPEHVRDWVHPDDRERVASIQGEALKDKRPFNVEFRIVRPDGSVRFIYEQAEIVSRESGRPAEAACLPVGVWNPVRCPGLCPVTRSG